MQKVKCLKNEKSFLDEIKNIFHSYKGLSFCEKIKIWWKIAGTSFKEKAFVSWKVKVFCLTNLILPNLCSNQVFEWKVIKKQLC